MEFGMPTLIEIYDLEESAKLCQELGLKFMELNMTFPQYQIEQMEDVERLQSIADKYGIYYTIHLDETMDVCNFNGSGCVYGNLRAHDRGGEETTYSISQYAYA